MPEVRAIREEGAPSALRRRGFLGFAALACMAGLLVTNLPTRQMGVNLSGAGVALISAWACYRRGSLGTSDAARAWRWISLAMLLQASGHLLRVGNLIGRRAAGPFPDVPDLLFLAVLPAFFVGLMLWPQAHRSPGRRHRTTLDAFIFGGSLLFIFWQLGLRDLASATANGTALYFILSFVLVCLDFGFWAYLVLPAAEMPTGPLGQLGLTLVGAGFVKMAAMLAGLSDSYRPGHWTDVLTLPVLVFPALAAWNPAPAALPVPAGEPEERPGGLQLLLPFIPAMAGLVVVMVQLLVARDRLDWQTAALAAVIVGVLFLRQFLSLWDLERLSKSLESRIRERTRELAHAQDVLVRTERMNAMATLGAGLAHDLKNLIGVVRNYALLVHRDLQEGRAAEMEDLESIQLASGQAVDLANQLMNYGRSEVEKEDTFDLTPRLRQLAAMLKAVLPAEITLAVEVPEGSMVLRNSPFHLDQMVVNLVLNARDALPGGGLIQITATQDRMESGAPAVRIEVEDNGTGMTETVKAHLFEPFFTTKPPGQGTGIGLASVKEALRGFGGRITVDSEPEKGTRFTVLLPLA